MHTVFITFGCRQVVPAKKRFVVVKLLTSKGVFSSSWLRWPSRRSRPRDHPGGEVVMDVRWDRRRPDPGEGPSYTLLLATLLVFPGPEPFRLARSILGCCAATRAPPRGRRHRVRGAPSPLPEGERRSIVPSEASVGHKRKLV